MSGITTSQGMHNVLYVATEHDSVYAIDADLGTIYTQVSLIPAGGSTVNSSTDLGCGDLVPEIGITGTPVIDPTTNTLYVVAKSKVSGTIVQYLHALDLTNNLAEKFGGPVQIQASVPGTGYDSSVVNGQRVVQFNSHQQNQRAALLLTQGHIVVGWSSHCDNDPWHGWIMSYNATTLAQEAAYNTSANGQRNGVWMSGGGPAADANGNIYFATGNGTWSAALGTGGTYTGDLGDSIVKLGPPSGGTFPVLDYFTPYNQATLANQDTDVASGGVVLLPVTNGNQLLAQQGKQGTIYLLNTGTGAMGEYCVNETPACTVSDTNVVQEIAGATSGIWGSPAYWNGNLYWTGANEQIRAWSVTFNSNGSATLSASPTSQSVQVFAFSAPTPSVSAYGTTNGIVWALDGSADDSTCDGGGSDCLGLYAYDATNLANLLYISSQAANNRDSPGTAHKFQTPIIANGKVYVGTVGVVTAYGLLANQPQAALSPVFSPAPGTFASATTVTMTDATAGASIYYTTNGTTPSAANGSLYSASSPPVISATTTLQAVAVASGYASSTVTGGTYTIGTTSGPVIVNLAASDNVYGIANTGTAVTNGGLDGDGNAYAEALIGSSVSWNGSTFAIGSAGSADAVRNTTITLPAGNYSILNFLGTGVNGNQASQTFVVTYTDGTTTSFTQSLSDWLTPQSYAGESKALAMAYRIQPTGATDNRTFNLYGYSFALNSAKSVKSLTLPANNNVVVLAVDLLATGTPTVANPTFSPAAGTYTSATTVTISDATAGASVYYTTNGTTPSATNGTLYSASSPPVISATTTLEAVAVETGYTTSGVTTGTYTISAASPVFSPAPGAFTSATTVTISDATAGASIYYTTNGTTPSATNGTLYSASSPPVISATTTLEAVAVASGDSNSAVTSGTYTIGSTTGPVSVSLSASDDVYGIANAGTAVTNGGLDADGYAYAEALIGSSVSWNGSTFAIGGAGVPDAVRNTTITLPAGNYSILNFLGTGVNGNQASQTFVVTYTDGTTTSFTQSLSDWFTPQKYTGETKVLAMAYRIGPTGAADNRTFNLYGYSLALNSAKTVKSLTLPANNNVVVLAVDLH